MLNKVSCVLYMKTHAGNVKHQHEEQKKSVAFHDASAFMCYSTLKIGKHYSFCVFFCFNWEKTNFLAIGTILTIAVSLIAKKNQCKPGTSSTRGQCASCLSSDTETIVF